MGIIVNNVISITKDTTIDAPYLNLNLNLNLNLMTVILLIVGGTIIGTLHYRIVTILQPPKVKEEDG